MALGHALRSAEIVRFQPQDRQSTNGSFLPALLAHGDEEIEQARSFLPTIGSGPHSSKILRCDSCKNDTKLADGPRYSFSRFSSKRIPS
jgi:hypothetical protein